MKGEIVSASEVQIDGEADLNMETENLMIGQLGKLKGDIKTKNADVWGEFDGTLEVSGTLTESSSKHIKENIRDIDNALQSVLALKGIKFDFTEDIREDDDNNTDVLGLIAEDTYDVCPELVSTNKNGKPVAISYSKIPALLIEAMKEQQKEIEDLKNQVKTLLN